VLTEALTPPVESAAPVEAAWEAARRAGPAWAATPLAARAAVLARAAQDLAAADWLAQAIARASGRPLDEVWSAEVLPTVDALRWLAGSGASALRPRRIPSSGLQWFFRPARHELSWEPFGVVGVVSPGNSLLFLAVPQIAGAILGGNAVLWKSAPAGAEVAIAVHGLFRRAGLPAGVLEVVPGAAPAARALVRAGVDKLFFTGGRPAGLALYRLQAEAGRPAVLELSGRHVALVLADAPPARTARGLVWGKLQNQGRNCVSVQLVLAERRGARALVEALSAAMASAAGVPRAPLSPEERARLAAMVADATARGARVAYGGPDEGLPAVLDGVAPGMRVADEEALGPILAVAPVDSAADAVTWVNASESRLSASVWSADVRRARQLAARLDVGQVWINDTLHPTAQPAVPLTGRGRSGFGASRGLAGLLETVQPKVVSVMPGWAPRFHQRAGSPATARLLAATARLGAATTLRARLGAGAALLRTVPAVLRRAR
jgi:acyl-CoA reductase-like NAD-dependent aldehyde dehydrogenase